MISPSKRFYHHFLSKFLFQSLEAEAKIAAEMAAAEATKTALDTGKKERLQAVSRAREEGRKALEAAQRKAKAAAEAAAAAEEKARSNSRSFSLSLSRSHFRSFLFLLRSTETPPSPRLLQARRTNTGRISRVLCAMLPNQMLHKSRR